MYIIDIIPITHLPKKTNQWLTYFHPEMIKKGALIQANLNHRDIYGIVMDCQPVSNMKIEVKSASFVLKKISQIVLEDFLDEKRIKLAYEISQYYFEDLSLVFKSMLPKNIKSLINYLKKNPIKPLLLPKTNISYKSKYVATRFHDFLSSDIWVEINATLTKQKQILVISPNISTLVYIQKILNKKIDKNQISIFSPELPIKKFNENYQAIASNGKQIILGLRSSVFAPFNNLGLIIVLDESNYSYKSWDQRPYYSAQTVAQNLAYLHQAQIIYQSDTPTTKRYDSWKNILKIKATTEIIDLKNAVLDKSHPVFNVSLTEKINETIKKNGRIILFLNRKGSASSIICQDCGKILKCPQCEVPLVLHKDRLKAICHHCFFKMNPPEICANCQSHRIKYLGSGIEKADEELKNIINDKEVRIFRLDGESILNSLKQISLIEEFNQTKKAILLGTEIIFKPQLQKADLTVALHPDPLLTLPDYQSEERLLNYCWQLKNLSKKSFVIQTRLMQNDIFQAIKNNQEISFLEKELILRKKYLWPPYCQIIKLTIKNKIDRQAEKEANLLSQNLIKNISTNINLKENTLILGPAPAFISKQKNLYHWNIIIKIKKPDELEGPLYERFIINRNQLLKLIPEGWKIDVDPISIL